jgi:hypothetical protein
MRRRDQGAVLVGGHLLQWVEIHLSFCGEQLNQHIALSMEACSQQMDDVVVWNVP